MAKKTADTLQKLEEQLTCHVCLELYKKPKILPCHHAFCQDCVGLCPRQFREGKYFLKCPTCSKPAQIPDGGAPALPPAFSINKLFELHQEMLAKQDVMDCPQHKKPWKHSVRLVRSWCALPALHVRTATIMSNKLLTSLVPASNSWKKAPSQ